MTRQQYRQLQRKRPELQLPEWSSIRPEYRKAEVETLTEAEFIARRAADLLATPSDGVTKLALNAINPPWINAQYEVSFIGNIPQ